MKRLQHLHLTYSSRGHSTHIHPGWNTSCSQWWKSYALPSRLKPHPTHHDERTLFFHPGRNHILLTMMEDFLTFIQARTTSCSQWWKNSVLSPRPEPHPAHNDGRTLFFHPGRNHILLTMMEYFLTFIQVGNTSYSQWSCLYAFVMKLKWNANDLA